MQEHLVIAGGGQAAAQAAQSARQAGFAGRISLFAEEASLPYQRPPLSKKFLAGEMEPSRLLLKPGEFYSKREIDVVTGTEVSGFDPAKRKVTLGNGDEIAYSHLVLATGSEPLRLAVPGVGLEGVHYLRRIGDVEAIRQEFAAGSRLVIVGAGYIGLEVAAVASRAGLDVTVLETADRVMARTACPEVSAFYAAAHRAAGVDLRLGSKLAAFHGDGRVRAVETSAGERFDCDLAIIGIGIRPRVELAERAGLELADGIAVDACGRTGAPGVFAAGDCSSHLHPWVGRRVRLESVQNALEQGKAAGLTIAGQEQAFDAVPWFWSDQYELKLQIAGLSEGYDETVVRGSIEQGSFSVYYLAAGRVIAVDAVNDPRGFITARQRLPGKPRWPAAAIADPDTELAPLPD